MKAMIHKLSKAQSKVIAAFLAIVMIFGVFAFIAPVEAQAVEIDAADAGFYNVSYGTDGETSFVEGSQIRVENTLRTSKNTGLYTLTDAGWTTTDNLVWNSAAENQFKAWYPATDYASFDTFELPTVQNTNALLAAADWMTASTEEMAKPSDKTLELNFQHLLTKVTINVNSWGNEYEDTAKSINDVKIYTLATDIVKNDAGEAVYNSISLTGIDPLVEDQAYTAIICPGAYTSDQEIMTFTVNNTDDLIVHAGNNTALTGGLEAGKHYEFNLTVGKDVVALESVSVSDWAEGGTIEGGVAEEADYIYDEATNTYTVYTADALLTATAIDNAGRTGIADNPATIKLMQDVEMDVDTEYSLMIEAGVVILDLNGYKINSADNTAIYVNGGATLTVCDSGTGGAIIANTTGIESYGELTVTGGTITANTFGIRNHNELTISGGTVISYNHVAIMEGTVILSGVPTLKCGWPACDIAEATIEVKCDLGDVVYTYQNSSGVEESSNFELFEGYSLSTDKTLYEKDN